MEVDNGLMNGEGTQLDSNSKVHSTPIDLHSGIDQVDPEIADLIHKEKNRQIRSLELIASENFTSQAVLDCLGSCFTNRYCEGYPGRRYYGGQEYCDALERICQQRAMEAYNLDSREWGVNVQPYSGSPANFAVYTAIVEPHGRIMGLDLPDGGHLTHGFQTTTRKVSATSIFFESLPYKVSPETGLIDYDMLSYTAKLFQPKLIIAGMSCYPRNLDYHRFRQIADKVGCFLMADMAHVSGLVAAGACANPFPYCDIVTTTTHKSLRGPRAGMIFYRKGVRGADKNGKEILYNLEDRINTALFPGLQGGPHMHQIAGIAVALKQAKTEEFASYINAVVSNAKLLGECLVNYGYTLVTGGTDTHLILVNFKPQKLAGSKVEYVLERMSITANKNTCPGDVSAFSPSGLRLGTPALTSRGFGKQEFIKVAEMVHLGIQLCQQIQSKCTSQKLDEFKNMADKEEFKDKINTLRMRVEEFACVFPMPGAMN